jgi:type I restriction enzyme S subunit
MSRTALITGFPKYPAYKDSGEVWLGQVPKEWELTRLGTRFLERKSKVSDKDFAPLSVTKNGIVTQLDNAAKSNDGDNRKLVKEGDFVINSRSDRKGSSGIAFEDGSVSLINIVMTPKGIHPTFCNYLLKSTAFVEENYRIGHGIVADLWTTRYDEMKNIKVAIPIYDEQTAIANFLDDKTAKIDRAIAQKEQLIALLKERKQIIIQNAVTKGLDPNVKMKDSGVEWIGEIPEGWEVKRLKYLVDSRTGFAFPSDQFEEEGLPLIRIGDLDASGEVSTYGSAKLPKDFEKYLKDYGLRNGDLLFAMTGGTIGKVAKFNGQEKALLNQRVCSITIDEPVFRTLIYNWMSTKYWKDFIDLHASGGAQPNISDKDVLELPIVICSENSEIKAIVAHIETQSAKIDQAIFLQQTQIEKLKEYKATLIDSAVTGKIKVC